MVFDLVKTRKQTAECDKTDGRMGNLTKRAIEDWNKLKSLSTEGEVKVTKKLK